VTLSDGKSAKHLNESKIEKNPYKLPNFKDFYFDEQMKKASVKNNPDLVKL
jgi:hypothetical protein